MSNKMSNKAREYAGKAKVFVGQKTNNPRLAGEGHRDQMAARAKQMPADMAAGLRRTADRGRDAMKR
jgi:uncharacterized protein YjbJ (UPF0337 family)